MTNSTPIDPDRIALLNAVFDSCPPHKLSKDPGREFAIPAIAATERPVLNKNSKFEILIMTGCQVPETAQIPLTYEHADILKDLDHYVGSFRRMIIQEDRLIGTACFHTSETATRLFGLAQNAHARFLSISFVADEADKIHLAAGESFEWNGKPYKARCGKPLVLVVKWYPTGLSIVRDPADPDCQFVYGVPPWGGFPLITPAAPNEPGVPKSDNDSPSVGDSK